MGAGLCAHGGTVCAFAGPTPQGGSAKRALGENLRSPHAYPELPRPTNSAVLGWAKPAGGECARALGFSAVWPSSAAMERADLIAVRIAQVGEIKLAKRAISPARRIFDALAAGGHAGFVEGSDLLGAVAG